MTTKMTKKAMMEQEKQEAIQELNNLFNEYGHVVYTELNHVSKSGMMRRISCYIKNESGFNKNITDLVSKIIGYNIDSRTGQGLRVSGCGMDMGFHVVYSLSCTMYRNADGSYSHDGAYKINQRWI